MKVKSKTSKKFKESIEGFLKDWKIQIYRAHTLRIGLLILIASLLLTLPMLRLKKDIDLKLGEPSPVSIVAPRDIVIPDEELQKREILKKLRTITGVYKIDRKTNESIRDHLTNILLTLDQIRNKKLPYKRLLRELPGLKLTKEEYEYLLSLSEEDWQMFQFRAERILNYLLTYRWKTEDVYSDRRERLLNERLAPELKKISDTTQVTILRRILNYVLEPNVRLDESLVKEKIRELEKNFKKPYIKIERGKYIIRKGEIVSKFHLKVLKSLGYLSNSPLKEFLYKFFLSLLLTSITALLIFLGFTGEYSKGLTDASRQLSETKLERSLILSYLLYLLGFTLVRLLGEVSPFLAPIAFISIILVLLLGYLEGALLGVLAVLYIPFIIGHITVNQLFLLILETLIASFLSIFIRKRWDFLKVLLGGLGVIVLTEMTMRYTFPYSSNEPILEVIGYLSGGFLLSIILSMGLLPFLENTLHFTSPIKLIELMNPLHPLLQRLYNEAPGTYNHSLMVANLAEQAAKAINADSLLCRVGAYYHDIGKIKRPEYFVENQFGNYNPHDSLNPRISAIYIISHVRDGIDLAKEYNLPPSIIDFIRTHHGTSLVYYFYHKAKSQGLKVSEAEFRYPGPKPFTKETAILMLADSIEASARTITNYDINTLKDLVEEIVRMKIEDEQLQNAPLTLAELEKIKNAFLKTLISTYHKRIRYPNQKVS